MDSTSSRVANAFVTYIDDIRVLGQDEVTRRELLQQVASRDLGCSKKKETSLAYPRHLGWKNGAGAGVALGSGWRSAQALEQW
eukprot:6315506-Ditylum_brightwellii.AAC.1